MKSITIPSSLTGSHRHTFEALFRHPLSHNIPWHDVYSLFARLGQVSEEANGSLKVTRNGQILVLRPPRLKDISETSELVELRHFLERSANPPAQVDAPDRHCLIVIDHHEIRVFHSEANGTVPTQVLPHEPSDFFRHAHNSKDFNRGMEKPDPNSFFEPVAQILKNAGKIIIFGNGKGGGSEMEQFITWLEKHHPDVLKSVVGSEVVDEHHLTDAQLLAKARSIYAAIPWQR